MKGKSMQIGSLKSVGFGSNFDYGVQKVEKAPETKMSTKKKIALIGGAVAAVALAAGAGIWAIKRGKNPTKVPQILEYNQSKNVSPNDLAKKLSRKCGNAIETALKTDATIERIGESSITMGNDGKLVHTVTDTPFLQEMREYMTRAFSDPKYAEQAAAVAA